VYSPGHIGAIPGGEQCTADAPWRVVDVNAILGEQIPLARCGDPSVDASRVLVFSRLL